MQGASAWKRRINVAALPQFLYTTCSVSICTATRAIYPIRSSRTQARRPGLISSTVATNSANDTAPLKLDLDRLGIADDSGVALAGAAPTNRSIIAKFA